MSVKLKFKNVNLIVDTYGEHIAVKMVQVWKDDKFIKNAKINKQLMETITKNYVEIDGLEINSDIQQELMEGAKKYKTNINDYLKFLIELNKVEAEKGLFKTIKTILYYILIFKKRKISIQFIREKTGCNFNVVKKAFEMYKKEIDKNNGHRDPRLF